MSREIKFRAWDKEEKEYYYDVEHTYDFFCSGRGCYAESFGEVLNQLDRFIVEQFTGLLDCNGKKIYVGDILKTCCGKAKVYFDDELLMYRIEVRHGGTMPLVSKKTKRHFDYEIIGNVHQNPELLGGEE